LRGFQGGICAGRGHSVVNVKRRKHQIANEYLREDRTNSSMFLILKSRASAYIWEIEEFKKRIGIKEGQDFV